MKGDNTFVDSHLKILGTKILISFILIILMSSITFAAEPKGSIKTIKAVGTAQIENIISDNDQIEFTVTASIEGDNDLNGNLILTDSTRVEIGKFSCKADPISGFLCNLKFPPDKKETFRQSEQKFKVYLQSDVDAKGEKTTLDIKDIILHVDNWAPRVTLFEISNIKEFEKKKFSSTGKVNINFDVEELGFDGDTLRCAGLKAVEFFLGKSADNKKLPVACTGNCLDSRACKIPGKSIEYQHDGLGEVNICAKAIDRVGKHSQDKCDTFFIDKDAPKISKDSKNLTDIFDRPINNIAPGKPIMARFSIEIIALDIDTSSVTADLSELNPDKANELNALAPKNIIPHKENKAITKFIWEFELNPKTEGTKKVFITAKDIFGNKPEKPEEVDFVFGKDEVGPVVKSLKSDKQVEGNHYAGRIDNFTAEIDDATGVTEKDIILHIESHNIKRQFIAKECKSEKGIICKWIDLDLGDFREGLLSVFIDTDSKDILGNPVKDKKEIKVILDKTPPKLEGEIKVTSKPTAKETKTNEIKTGDILEINAVVVDSNKITATADLTSAIIKASQEEIPCKQKDFQWDCEKQIGPVDRIFQGDEKPILKFAFTDIAGNKLTEDVIINVIKTEGQPQGALFNLKILDNLIQPIEISTLRSMVREDHQLIIPVKLEPTSICKGAEILNERLLCPELGKNGIILFKNADIYSGWVEFFITKDNVGDKEVLSIGAGNSCFIQYNTICGNVFYKTPEEQKLKVNVFVSRESITHGEAVQRKIDDIKRDVNEDWKKVIDGLDKGLTFAGNMCNVKQGFAAAITSFAAIHLLFSGIKDSVIVDKLSGGVGSSGVRTSGNFIRSLSDAYNKLDRQWFNTMCGYAKCQGSHSPIERGGDQKYIEPWKWNACDFLRKELEDPRGFFGISGVGLPTLGIKSDLGTLYGGTLPSNLELAQKNLYFALGCFCIPGVLANLQKGRQIQCKKGVCLRDLVPTGFKTPADCDNDYDLDNCIYVKGRFWFLGIFYNIGLAPLRALANFVENPIASSFVITRGVARKGCIESSKCVSGICSALSIATCKSYAFLVALENFLHANQVRTAIRDYFSFKSSVETNDFRDYCKVLNEDPVSQQPVQQQAVLPAQQPQQGVPSQAQK